MHLCYNKQYQLKIISRVLGLILVLSVSIGCSGNTNNVKVIDKSRSYNANPTIRRVNPSPKSGTYTNTSSGQHVVQKGETLYSIAFRYGWDFHTLANRNNISSPYTIYPGQTVVVSSNTTTKSTNPVQTKTTTTTTNNKSSSIKKTVVNAPVETGNTGTSTKGQAVSGGWQWPANGMIVGSFSPSSTLNKGIDIAGSEGDPVLAASAGTVVYAGNNLHGYGELLIIKHNDSYVSAYGHNSKLLVKEGQKIAKGQRIANMGSTGADRVKLHFEIRLNGKPVNPTNYLPKR